MLPSKASMSLTGKKLSRKNSTASSTSPSEDDWSDDEANNFLAEDFIDAVHDNDIDEMGYLLKHAKEPLKLANICDTDSFSVLILACAHGRLEAVKLLLNYNANPTYRAQDGSTALLCAVQDGHLKVVHHLLQDPRVDVNETLSDRNALLNPLCMAARESKGAAMVRLLLHNKADINMTCGLRNDFPLIYAVKANNLLTLRVLLQQHDVDMNKRNSKTETALLYAVRNPKVHTNILALLLSRKADPDLYSRDGMNACLMAAFYGENETLKLVVEAKADLTLKCRKTSRSVVEIFQEEHDEPFPMELLTMSESTKGQSASAGKISPPRTRGISDIGIDVHIAMVKTLLRNSERVTVRIPRTVMGKTETDSEREHPMCCISVTLSLGKKLANQKITWQVDRPYLSFRALYKTLKRRFGQRKLQEMRVQMPSLPRFVMWNLKHSMNPHPDQLMPHELIVSLTDFLCAVMRMPERVQEAVDFLTPSPATAKQLYEFVNIVRNVQPEMDIVERTAEALNAIVSRADQAFAKFEDNCISLRGALVKLDFTQMDIYSKEWKPPLCSYSRACRDFVTLLSTKPENTPASADVVYVGAQHLGQVLQSREKLVSIGKMFISEVESLRNKTKKQGKLLHYSKGDLLQLIQYGMTNYERLDLHITSCMVNLKSKVDVWERSCEKQIAKPDPELETKPPVPLSPIVLT